MSEDEFVGENNLVVPVAPELSRVFTLARALGGDMFAFEVTAEALDLIAADTGTVFGRIRGERIWLRLRRQDAVIEEQVLGGWIEEIGAADVVDLVLVGEDLYDQERIGRAATVSLRALHLAAAGTADRDDLTVDDLAFAVMQRYRFADGPVDMHDYWVQRLDEMRSLFGLAPSDLALQDDDPATWHRELYWKTLEGVAEDANENMHPFRRFHEMDAELVAATNDLSNQLGELEDQRRAVSERLIAALLTLIEPTLASRAIPREDLFRAGVALEPPRDELHLMFDHNKDF